MLTAIPGRGRITNVTVANMPGHDHLAARLIPHPAYVDPVDPGDQLVDVVQSVDIVLPHGNRGVGATGLVLSVSDADAAKQLGRALYRAAVLLGQQVPASALDTVEGAGDPIPVEGLPDMTIASVPADA